MNMVYLLRDVSCGAITIDAIVPNTISLFVTILKIAIPIILIILGMLDMAKAVMANEEKEMKEAQKKLIKRLIYAVVIFFIVALVQFLFKQLDNANGGESVGASSCINCFINGECK